MKWGIGPSQKSMEHCVPIALFTFLLTLFPSVVQGQQRFFSHQPGPPLVQPNQQAFVSPGAICQPVFSEGSWHWQRSPEQEQRRIQRLYNVHCVRCHGVSGRGVWDIPDVPDFTNTRWQSSRSLHDLARLTLEGRGACMPAFKGIVTIEEAYAIGRMLQKFDDPPQERPPQKMGSLPSPNSGAAHVVPSHFSKAVPSQVNSGVLLQTNPTPTLRKNLWGPPSSENRWRGLPPLQYPRITNGSTTYPTSR